MLILDTDHFSVLLGPLSEHSNRLSDRLSLVDDEVAITIVAVEELLRGWLAAIHRTTDPPDQLQAYSQLQQLLNVAAEWKILPWEEQAIEMFRSPRPQHRRIGTMDLKIAAIAMAHQGVLLTRNFRDFAPITELMIEDWLSVS